MREVQTLRAREHPHIVPLLASYTEHSIESGYGVRSLNLFFPYAEMDMYQWLYLSKTPANLPKTWAQPQLKDYIYGIILSLCSALAYLHREVDGLISSHHDLKPKNIILFGQSWKIADFGRTHLIDLKTGSDTEGQCGLGTFTYNPPEYWDDLGRRANVRHGRAFDIWAMGCIIIELATVAVHGWSSEGLERFRQNRRENRARPLTFQSVEPSTDDSFHNNLGVVKDWFHKLEVFDGSSNLIQILEITSQMLDIDSRKRPSSWEIELNLSEVLNPNETNTVKADRTFSVIQRPGPNDLKGTHNPLQRAAMQGNKLRVRCLLDSGWHANMVDTQFIERNSQAQGCIKNEILDMLETSWQQANFAVVVQKLPWRRLMHQMREWQEKNHPQGYMEPKFKHDCKFATKYPVTALGTEIPWKQLLGGPPGVARKATERNAFHTSAFEQQDAAGMTSLHRACRDGNVWTVINLLGKLDSGFMRARLFTLQDATGKLPLHHAAKKGSSTMMLLLLESFKFGSITTFYPTSLATLRDFNGRTPIHMAAQSGNLVAIELLANASANAANYLNIRDDDGNTAWDLAAKYRQKEAADALAKLRFG